MSTARSFNIDIYLVVTILNKDIPLFNMGKYIPLFKWGNFMLVNIDTYIFVSRF